MKFFLKTFFLFIPLLAGLYMATGCHKELFTSKGDLSFSTDTLTFDTVFTTLGSTTRSFTIRNTQSKAVNISSIKLLQLQGTQFRINVNGVSGTQFSNVVIPARDSIYAFAEVTINPSIATNPFVIFDEIQFVTNGNTQNVVLEAMGQNAYYHFSDSIQIGAAPWPNDKPHIIVNKNGGLPILEILPGATLTIQPNTQIYMGPNAVITVDGSLVTSPIPNWSDSVKFQYIRTDYPNQPGLWLGITFGRSATSASSINLSHVIIDQSTFGISDEYVLDLIAQSQITTSNLNSYIGDQKPSVTLDKVIIRNTSTAAMDAIDANVTATNCLFFSCGGYMITLGMGGTYNFTNCTFANGYSTTQTSQNQILSVIDQVNYLGVGPIVGPYATTVNVNNSIIAGNTAQNELSFYGLAQPSSDHMTFNNCFLSEMRDSLTAFHITNTNNGIDTSGDPQQILQPMLFSAPNLNFNNYMPDTGSIVIGKGNDSSTPDLFDYPRSGGLPCIGAIQWHH